MGNFKKAFDENKIKESMYHFFLAKTCTVGIKTYAKLEEHFDSLEEFYNSDFEALVNEGVLTKATAARLNDIKRHSSLEKEYESMLSNGIRLITFESDFYPEKLKNIPDPPIELFLKGRLVNPQFAALSVIGARECSEYGANIARRTGELIGENQIQLISGMARGIDSISQEACVNAGGYSLAVLGGGVDVIYPRESGKLYRSLLEKGGIISEYVPGTVPKPMNFAARNRIISGLSDTLCVIEAKEKSGTMITVEAALNQGKEVYAVPGRITDITSFGTNSLIANGAGIITDLDRFVEEFVSSHMYEYPDQPVKKVKKLPLIAALSENEIKILKVVEDTSYTIDQLSSKTGIPAFEILTLGISLYEKGLFNNMGGGRFKPTNKGIDVAQILIAEDETDEEDEKDD